MVGGVLTAFPILFSENEMIYKLGSAAIFISLFTWLFLLFFYIPLLLMFGPDYNWGRLFATFDFLLNATPKSKGRQIKQRSSTGDGSDGSSIRTSERSSV